MEGIIHILLCIVLHNSFSTVMGRARLPLVYKGEKCDVCRNKLRESHLLKTAEFWKDLGKFFFFNVKALSVNYLTLILREMYQ